MELGKEMGKLRKNIKLTQVELSKKTKVGLRLIRYIEQGGKNFRYDKLDLLLNFFGYHLEIEKDEPKMSYTVEQLELKL
ncbi:MAG: helix-turn-helix domain-containing protein [Endomicrobiaceae bacterium]|nr:helix-turn-helix domain-containing protein [Endomicrobiaceae bacterium]